MENNFITFRLTSNDLCIVKDVANIISKHAITMGVDPSKKDSIIKLIKKGLTKRINDNININGVITISTYEKSGKYVIGIQDKGIPYLFSSKAISLFKSGVCDNYKFMQLGKDGILSCFEYDMNFIPQPKEKERISEELLDRDFIIRKTKPIDEDINEVIKCLYDAYKYEYIHQNLYNFNKFREELNSGNYHSFLVENKHHQIVGHAALHEYYPFNGLPEYGNLVTKSIARGNGIAEKTITYLTSFAKQCNYNGVLVSCFAAHPFTEKICNKSNYTPCSAIFQLVGPDTAGDYKNGNIRFDLLNAVTLFDKNKKHIIYAPNFVKPLLDYVFNKEQVEYELISEVKDALKGESKISYDICIEDQALTVYADWCGEDLIKIAKEIMKNRIKAGVDLTTININASNPTAIKAIHFLKDNGFIFTGIIPGSNNGDYLIMQKFFTQKFSTKHTAIEKNYDVIIELIKQVNGIVED